MQVEEIFIRTKDVCPTCRQTVTGIRPEYEEEDYSFGGFRYAHTYVKLFVVPCGHRVPEYAMRIGADRKPKFYIREQAGVPSDMEDLD